MKFWPAILMAAFGFWLVTISLACSIRDQGRGTYITLTSTTGGPSWTH